MTTPIIILAAGRSARMRGTDKLLLPVAGVPLLRGRALTAIATGEPVVVVLPAPDHPRAAMLRDLPVTLHFPGDAALGIAHSLRSAVACLPVCDRMLILLADLPGLTSADLLTVISAPLNHPDALIWRGADKSGMRGHPVLFDARLRPAFTALHGDTGAEAIIRANHDKTALVTLPGDHATRDLDTPEDWVSFRLKTER